MKYHNLEYRIRSYFLKIDTRDYFFSPILKFFYKFITINKKIENLKKIKIKKKIDNDLIHNGFKQLDSNDEIKNLIYNRSYEIFESEEFKREASNRKTYLNQYKIDLSIKKNHIYLKLILSNSLINTIHGYLGNNVVLSNLQLWHSKNDDFVSGGSQDLHMDGEDTKQIKLFFYLSDVDKDAGPLSVISKKQSKILNYRKNNKNFIKRKTQKISDDEFKNISNNIEIHLMTGSKGSVNLIDTSNCYHFGSRPGKKSRKVLMYQFVSSYSYYLPMKKNYSSQIYSSEILSSDEINIINTLLY